MTESPNAPAPGTLRLIQAHPNPHGADEAQLFLFEGNPTVEPVCEIVLGEGVSLPDRRGDLSSQPFRLRVLHFNDLHGHISRFTAHGHQPVFSKIVWRLRQVRRQHRDDPNAAVLVLTGGDDLVGAVFDELLGDDPQSFTMHAGYRLYSAAGIDAATLGNHDLDMGPDLLAHAIRREARFPLLSANLVDTQWLKGLYYPAALMVLKGVRVGLIGLTSPAGLHPQIDTDLHVVNPIQVVDNLLPVMRPLCDVLIILSHLGYKLSSSRAAMRDAGDVELARSLPRGGAHLIVGGHTHHVLNEQGLSAHNIVNGIAIVQAGSLGRFLGEVDITLRHSAAVTNVRLTSTADLPVDEDFEKTEVQPLVTLAQPLFGRALGPVASHPDLGTDAVRNAFAAGESALANFITSALVTRCQVHGHDVDLAVLDASSVRCGLPVGGELTFGDWFNLMPFADTIRLCWITGHQLKALLEDNARRADRPDEPHTERGFLQFSHHIRYTIELGHNRREAKAVDITLDGQPIEEQLGRSLLIACSSFVRRAASVWEAYARQYLNMPLVDIREWPRIDTHLFLRDEMIAYIREHGGVTEAGGARLDGRLEIVWPSSLWSG